MTEELRNSLSFFLLFVLEERGGPFNGITGFCLIRFTGAFSGRARNAKCLQGNLTHDLRPSRVNHQLIKPGRKSIKREVSEMKVKCPYIKVELADDL